MWSILVLPGCKKSEPASPEQYMTTFHTIEPGKAYRTGQLSPEALTWAIDHHGIKTVLNLRGHNPDKPWYKDEVRVCRDRTVTLVDVSMSSRKLPPPDMLKSILNTLRTAAGPILIHCESGSDRTGLVAGLYRLDVLEQNLEAAEGELTADYGHFRAGKPCMDTFIEMYQPTPEWMAGYEKDYATLKCK
jgi:protein tyrosine/serine phosphatase